METEFKVKLKTEHFRSMYEYIEGTYELNPDKLMLSEKMFHEAFKELLEVRLDMIIHEDILEHLWDKIPDDADSVNWFTEYEVTLDGKSICKYPIDKK